MSMNWVAVVVLSAFLNQQVWTFSSNRDFLIEASYYDVPKEEHYDASLADNAESTPSLTMVSSSEDADVLLSNRVDKNLYFGPNLDGDEFEKTIYYNDPLQPTDITDEEATLLTILLQLINTFLKYIFTVESVENTTENTFTNDILAFTEVNAN